MRIWSVVLFFVACVVAPAACGNSSDDRRDNIEHIFEGERSYYMGSRAPAQDGGRPSPPPETRPTWTPLDLPSDDFHYRYAREGDVRFTARASGELDTEETSSTFELLGIVNEDAGSQ